MDKKLEKTAQKRDEIEKKINLEVRKDRNFLKQLKENPHQVLQEKFAIEIPQHIKICHVVEEPNTWHFVIRASAISGKPLSDSDLASMAGGECWL